MSKNPSVALFFYQGDKLITVKEGPKSRTVLRSQQLPLAELHDDKDLRESKLISSDIQGSVLNSQTAMKTINFSYSPYGHAPECSVGLTLLGFNGEHCDSLSHYYLLGSGYRAHNPVQMRFNSPDSWSPFGKGGVNAYSYCGGDPVNHTDPSGHMFARLKKIIGVGPRRHTTPEPASQTKKSSLSQPGKAVDPVWEDMRLNPFNPDGPKKFFGSEPPSYIESLEMRTLPNYTEAVGYIQGSRSSTISRASRQDSTTSQASRRNSSASQISQFSIDHESEATRQAYLGISQASEARRVLNETILGNSESPPTPRRETLHIRRS